MSPKSQSGHEQGPLPEGPVRSCVGCGARRAQAELTRVALDPEGVVVVDKERRLPGRGAYLCGAGCLTAALKRKAFGRAFRGRAGKVDPLKLEQAWESGSGPRGVG
jgi:predicted RNA-binding protein YlxR (DUF448 family)